MKTSDLPSWKDAAELRQLVGGNVIVNESIMQTTVIQALHISTMACIQKNMKLDLPWLFESKSSSNLKEKKAESVWKMFTFSSSMISKNPLSRLFVSVEYLIRILGNLLYYPFQRMGTIAGILPVKTNKKYSAVTRLFAGLGFLVTLPFYMISQMLFLTANAVSYLRHIGHGIASLYNSLTDKESTIKPLDCLASIVKNILRLLPTVFIIVACVFAPALTAVLEPLKYAFIKFIPTFTTILGLGFLKAVAIGGALAMVSQLLSGVVSYFEAKKVITEKNNKSAQETPMKHAIEMADLRQPRKRNPKKQDVHLEDSSTQSHDSSTKLILDGQHLSSSLQIDTESTQDQDSVVVLHHSPASGKSTNQISKETQAVHSDDDEGSVVLHRNSK